MIFTVIITQIGGIFIRSTQNHQLKHLNTIIYFGIGYLLILISTGIALLRDT
ncbi:MAG: hypothetical protein HC896_07725 [Bacteroidales bacterium]|nr:hypothetical protein [Bacteroidales bacterium]